MTDVQELPAPAVETPETVAADALYVVQGLHKRRPMAWWTAAEIGNVLNRWPALSVRRALRALADDGRIDTRLSGTDERPLREYRGKMG